MKKKKLIYLVSAVILFILSGLLTEWVYFSDFEYRVRTKRFNRILAEKEKTTENCLNTLKIILEKGDEISDITKSDLFGVLRKDQITLLEYVDNKLVYWSDNSFEIPVVFDDSLFGRKPVFLHNGWFLSRSFQYKNEKIIALLRLSNNYSFENDLVRSGFVKSFRVPEMTRISFEDSGKSFRISDGEGEWIFSLVYPQEKEPSPFIILPLFFWILALASILAFSCATAKYLASLNRHVLSFITSVAISCLVYFSVLVFRVPSVFFESELFSGYMVSLSSIIPSLGHLFLAGILAVFPAVLFYRYFPLKIRDDADPVLKWLIMSALLSVGAALMAGYHNILTDLIVDSGINFEPHRVLDLSAYSVIGFISFFLLLLVPVFYLVKVLKETLNAGLKIFVLSLIIPALLFTLTGNSGPAILPAAIFFLLFVILARQALKTRISRFNMTVVFSMLFGLYTLFYIIELSGTKNIENKKVLAVAYSTEHDPEAEHLLISIWPSLSADTVLKKRLMKEDINQNDLDFITGYLHDTWFNGYWGNFNLSVVTCSNDSPLWITSEEMLVDNCFEFFNERLRKYGHQLTGTGFWFLDNQGGRSYYMGQLFYEPGDEKTNGLFIELYSDIDAFQAGYSELLLDKKYQGYMKLKDYSFAKYINGNLVLRTGDFPYDKSDAQYVDKEYDYRLFTSEKYRHVLYKNGNVTVMISEKRITPLDLIISLAYLFAFILLMSNLVLVLQRLPDMKSLFGMNFRQKLQISFITVLLFSFIAVGVGVAFFSIRQYQARHLENIKEKINSIYTELENKLSMEHELDSDWKDPSYPSLNELLISLSNIFNTDINLYDDKGFLLATSRPEVFYRDLTSRRLNMDAFINLENLTKSEYIQKERIASLEFISAYVPFYNDADKLLAYLNLPYFRMQSVLTREISNVIVAVVNFTLILIVLTMAIAVIISGRLTTPLRMLSEGIGSVELGKKSEHLSYSGKDEISEIVDQYNRMVDELQESARKLASSERESAWRDMAKQVAHEIKNPLTPMKLNIQQLYKSWKDGIPGFDRKLENFTKNQIEYIETLSSIASAFSSFAKLPAANPSSVDITEQIRTTLELFKNEENITFRTDWPTDSRIIVNADKEHLNGIFSNLIKNAIQSVSQGKAGIIKIKISVDRDRVTISVEDNGSGIPEELKKNMFIPNFTTKSSGTGLGLSIVKRYVETANGRIWFESQKDKGSVFYVELPVAYTIEKIG